nr:10551_t:CDS:2 [Entrophospora candida]
MRAVKQTPTNSYALKDSMMQCENGQINVLEHRHCIINYCNAPAGDSFCGIRVDSNNVLQTSLGSLELLIRMHGMLILAYFGSFSGRAFRYPPPVANRATFSELTGSTELGKFKPT